jgi:predicted oxidoreductase (fatty acid repression mutant protein)
MTYVDCQLMVHLGTMSLTFKNISSTISEQKGLVIVLRKYIWMKFCTTLQSIYKFTNFRSQSNEFKIYKNIFFGILFFESNRCIKLTDHLLN